MKKSITLAIGIFLLINTKSVAQLRNERDFLSGPVAGFGHSWVSTGSAMFIPSGYVGISCIDFTGRHIAIGGQLAASPEGFRINYYGTQQTVIPVYLRVPLRAYYFFREHTARFRPDIFFGPSFGLKLSEYSTPGTNYKDRYMARNPEVFKRFDFGLDGGAGIDITLTEKTSINVALEYYKGITDVIKEPLENNEENHDLELSLSLLFKIR